MPGGVLFETPPDPHPITAPDANNVSARPNGMIRQLRLRLLTSAQPKSTMPLKNTSDPLPLGRDLRLADIAARLVWIVSVAVAGVVPLGVSDAGLTTQVAFAGVPAQDKLTAWLNPPAGVTETVALALLPAVTLPVDGEIDTVKLGADADVTVTNNAVEVEVEKLGEPPYSAEIE